MTQHLSGGRLAERLEAWPRWQAWLTIIAAAAALVSVDHAYPGIGMGPLYVPLICAAGWSLGEREAHLVAIAATILSVIPSLGGHGDQHLTDLGLEVLIRLSSYVFIAVIISSFRRSFNRERFMASRDLMTGAMNKAAFERDAERLLRVAGAGGRIMLLATIDLDDFKTLNDRHGHATGDAALRAFASGVAAVIRRQDCFGRIGGDEFAVLIAVHSAEDGRTMAHLLHERLAGVLRELPQPVTCSMGALVTRPATNCDLAALMNEADRLMYAAKRSKKGGVRIAVRARGLDDPRSIHAW